MNGESWSVQYAHNSLTWYIVASHESIYAQALGNGKRQTATAKTESGRYRAGADRQGLGWSIREANRKSGVDWGFPSVCVHLCRNVRITRTKEGNNRPVHSGSWNPCIIPNVSGLCCIPDSSYWPAILLRQTNPPHGSGINASRPVEDGSPRRTARCTAAS